MSDRQEPTQGIAFGEPQLPLLDYVSSAFDLATFLRCAVDFGVATLKSCSAGSAFLYDAASRRLKLTSHTYPVRLSLSLTRGKGVAGKAFEKGEMLIVPRTELSEVVVPLEELNAGSFRSMVAIPVPRGAPQAVFCFDFHDPAPPEAETDGLTPSERDAAKDLDSILQQREFCNALQRIRANEAIVRIHKAGEAPGRLRQEVSEFLTRLNRVFRDSGKPPPDLACVQIVDRRRGTIRTVQGAGVPISFHTSVSYPLDGKDIQAVVATTRKPQIIVGNDEDHFDQNIYRKYKHERFVRLWIPLFPRPFMGLAARTDRELESLLSQWILWRAAEQRGPEAMAVVGHWNAELHEAPPPSLVFGTIELGYLRVDPTALDFAPLSTELASWAAVKAWLLSGPLFESTLPGALEAIGHTAAAAAAERTVLTVAMPDWRRPQVRNYPIGDSWPAAVSVDQAAVSSPPLQPAMLSFPSDHSDTDTGTGGSAKLRRVLKKAAEDAVRLALRLDDYTADTYLLITEIEDRNYRGTAVPDPKLEPLLREICREVSAEACAMLELSPEGGTEDPESGVAWAFRVTLSDASGMEPSPHLVQQAKKAIAEGTAWFGDLEHERWPAVAILPLELADATRAALLFFHARAILEAQERTALESRVARWVHRLSLRRLVVMGRFSTLMREMREWVSEARRRAEEDDGRHLLAFVEALFLRIYALGAVLTIYSMSPSGPIIVQRFWGCRSEQEKNLSVDSELFVGSSTRSPGWQAADEGHLVVYRPGESRRERGTEQVNQKLIERAAKLRMQGEGDRADRLERIVKLARGKNTTMVIAPLSGHGSSSGRVKGAFTVFLGGEHRFDPTQQQLVLELAGLVAEGVGQMRELAQQGYEKRHSVHLDQLRDRFGRAESADEVIGHLFTGMGRAAPSAHSVTSAEEPAWDFADDAVLWILNPESQELVVRSARGRGLLALAESLVVKPNQHPFIAKTVGRLGKKHLPKRDLANFRIWTFPLHETSGPVCQAYTRLSDVQWLVSFALQDADGRIRGVIDCLRERPLLPEEERALRVLLRRLSIQLCAALERTRHRRAIKFAHRVTADVMSELSQLRASDAYAVLMSTVRQEMGCEHCDLFLERDGKVLLHTTTRDEGPQTPAQRYDYLIEPEKKGDLLLSENPTGSRRIRIRHAAQKAAGADRLSPKLASLLAADHRFERMVVPLQREKGTSGSTSGLLYLRGPISCAVPEKGITGENVVKKSGIFTREHLREARDFVVVLQRLVTMADLVEQQEWLVNELQHALGQPLQGLRTVCDDAIRALIARGATRGDLAALRLRLDRSSELVQEGRNQLAAFSKMGQPADPVFGTVDLSALVKECCSFKDPEARQRSCSIACGRVQRLPSISADATWLRQAILNLLDNAVKYSYTNRAIEVVLREDARGTIRLAISDYGIGIPRSDRWRVFDPYFRSRVPDVKRPRPGSGIGLAIVRHAIEHLHKGKVTVTSKPTGRARVGETAEQTANTQYKTRFTITIHRHKLARLAGSADAGSEEKQ